MNRKETTKLLGEILIHNRLLGMGKHYAKEVSVDYGTKNVKRVDFMQFVPGSCVYISNIEKGIFICYEIKSCIEDVYSGNGLNFYGEKNYIVTTMETYKRLQEDLRSGKLVQHITETNPESSMYFGVMVPIPYMTDVYDEYENPTPLNKDIKWELKAILPCREGPRKRSMSELLFYMLRSKHSYSNMEE